MTADTGLIEGWASGRKPTYDFTGTRRHPAYLVGGGWPADHRNLTSLLERFRFFMHCRRSSQKRVRMQGVGLKRRGEETPGIIPVKKRVQRFMAVIFPDADLHIFDYNRVVKDLNVIPWALWKNQAAGFKIDKKRGEDVYKSGSKALLRHVPGRQLVSGVQEKIIPDHVIDSLDVTILKTRFWGPISRASNPRTDKRIDFVGGIRGLEELEKRCLRIWKIAFAVHPAAKVRTCLYRTTILLCRRKEINLSFEPGSGQRIFLHQL